MPKKVKRKKDQKNGLIVFLWLVIFCTLIVTGFFLKKNNTLKIASNDNAKNSLQLDVFYPSQTPNTPVPTTPLATTAPRPTTVSAPIADTATPTPDYTAVCPPDSIVPNATCKCLPYEKRVGFCLGKHLVSCTDAPQPPWAGPQCTEFPGTANAHYVGPCQVQCVYKPVIYLYPEKQTLITVSIKTDGFIYVSNPLIDPLTNEWSNVLANPDGKLQYQGRKYQELFYETQTSPLKRPKTGIIIKTTDLESKLRYYITLLGLTQDNEQKEFLDFWTPKLQELHSLYVFFSILEPDEKERIDNVNISPKPDVFIGFIAYFKPLQKPEQVTPLEVTPAPTRHGFTAVEWGGTIEIN